MSLELRPHQQRMMNIIEKAGPSGFRLGYADLGKKVWVAKRKRNTPGIGMKASVELHRLIHMGLVCENFFAGATPYATLTKAGRQAITPPLMRDV